VQAERLELTASGCVTAEWPEKHAISPLENVRQAVAMDLLALAARSVSCVHSQYIQANKRCIKCLKMRTVYLAQSKEIHFLHTGA